MVKVPVSHGRNGTFVWPLRRYGLAPAGWLPAGAGKEVPAACVGYSPTVRLSLDSFWKTDGLMPVCRVKTLMKLDCDL